MRFESSACQRERAPTPHPQTLSLSVMSPFPHLSADLHPMAMLQVVVKASIVSRELGVVPVPVHRMRKDFGVYSKACPAVLVKQCPAVQSLKAYTPKVC